VHDLLRLGQLLPLNDTFNELCWINILCNMNEIPILERDEAFAITADFLADMDARKVSLGAGVYRDQNSKPWVLPSVKLVCRPLGDAIGLSDCSYSCQ
jgi:hypothetical protein